MGEVIQSLWIGARLSALERLSVSSFLAHGHEYHLYVYADVDEVPRGAALRDAREILPAEAIFQYTEHASYAGFSNYFRYKLLLERGGWWVDADVVCLRPFAFEADHVFASERFHGRPIASSAAIKAPAGSRAMRHAWQVCEAKDPSRIRWGETGPRLVAETIEHCGLQRCLQPPGVFCPIEYGDWERFLDPGVEIAFGPSTVAVHVWNEMWRRAGRDKDADYDPACLFERLKRSTPARLFRGRSR